jgi:hypothetical protein
VTVVGGRYRITYLKYESYDTVSTVQICIQRKDDLGSLPNIFGTAPQMGFHVRRCSGSTCDMPVFIQDGQCVTIEWNPESDVIYSVGGVDDAVLGRMTDDGYFGYAHMVPNPIIYSPQLGASLNIVDIAHMLNGNTIYMDISCPGSVSFDVEVYDNIGSLIYKNTYTCSGPQTIKAYNLTVSSPLYTVKITFGDTVYTMDSKYLEGGLVETPVIYSQNLATLTSPGEGDIVVISFSGNTFTAYLNAGGDSFDFVYGQYNISRNQWDFQKSVTGITGSRQVSDTLSPAVDSYPTFIAGGKNWDMTVQIRSVQLPTAVVLTTEINPKWGVEIGKVLNYARATYKGVVAESLFWLPGETKQAIDTVLIPVTYGIWDRVDSDLISVSLGIKSKIATNMTISQV